MITVVIPYYQREAGILAKALASIAAQQPAGMPVQVLVVDDASPVPAEPELEALGTFRNQVHVIRQPNGGPGAARNAGLDHAPAGTRYIAFLDSDDTWSTDHLARATAALGAGYSFYFADHVQLGATVGAFARAGRIQPGQHPQIPGGKQCLYGYFAALEIAFHNHLVKIWLARCPNLW